MKNEALPRLDKTAFDVVPLHDDSDEKSFWKSKSGAERLQAVEYLRQVAYAYDPATTRLQRVLEIVERTGR